MDGAEFHDTVEQAKRTELDRLGSSKLVVALTGADMTTENVLQVAADSEHSAHNTFSEWAQTEDDDRARAAFENAAAQEADHRERVLAAFPGDVEYDPADGGPMHAYLRGREDTIPRVAAGMVGRSMVSLRTHTQVINFFVNEIDETRANLIRDLKEDTRGTLDEGLDVLETVCESDEDWEAAQMAAEYVIQVAYDDYADALTELGLEVKNIC